MDRFTELHTYYEERKDLDVLVEQLAKEFSSIEPLIKNLTLKEHPDYKAPMHMGSDKLMATLRTWLHRDNAAARYERRLPPAFEYKTGADYSLALINYEYEDLAHEIRNPMTVIAGFAKRVLRKPEGEHADALARIAKTLNTMELFCIKFEQRHMRPTALELSDHITATYDSYRANDQYAPLIVFPRAERYQLFHDPLVLAHAWEGVFDYISASDGERSNAVAFRGAKNDVDVHFHCPFRVKYPFNGSLLNQKYQCGYFTLDKSLRALDASQGHLHVEPRGNSTRITVTIPYSITPRV